MQERRILRRKHQIFNFHHHDSFAGRNNGYVGGVLYIIYKKYTLDNNSISGETVTNANDYWLMTTVIRE